ncbi:MAG: DUF3842 family protein [Clostridia bacterium]|nr:DUF3842 family protein [Clostridia bacterium]
MRIAVIDGQGGRLGQLLVEAIREADIACELVAIGTNSIATSAMLKAGAPQGATGENPVIVAARTADAIVGPVGIVIADSLLGEVTPKMAAAVGQSKAVKFLCPVSHCNNRVVGVKPLSMKETVAEAVAQLKKFAEGEA